MRRYFSFKNIRDFFRFFGGIFDAWNILKEFKPDVLFLKGGFVSLPVAIAGSVRKIKMVAHESDTVPGIANMITASFANTLCTSFPIEALSMPKTMPKRKNANKKMRWVHTGTPIRSEIFNGDRRKGKDFLGFYNENPILLVLGGSQGAVRVNNLIYENLKQLLWYANIVVLAGEGNAFEEQEGLKVFEYLKGEYPDVLAASDIVLSRAGSNSLFDIAAAEKPNLLIPLPESANNHQQKNAEFFEKKGASKILSSSDPIGSIIHLLQDEGAKKRQQSALKDLVILDGAKRIVQELICCSL